MQDLDRNVTGGLSIIWRSCSLHGVLKEYEQEQQHVTEKWRGAVEAAFATEELLLQALPRMPVSYTVWPGR